MKLLTYSRYNHHHHYHENDYHYYYHRLVSLFTKANNIQISLIVFDMVFNIRILHFSHLSNLAFQIDSAERAERRRRSSLLDPTEASTARSASAAFIFEDYANKSSGVSRNAHFRKRELLYRVRRHQASGQSTNHKRIKNNKSKVSSNANSRHSWSLWRKRSKFSRMWSRWESMRRWMMNRESIRYYVCT